MIFFVDSGGKKKAFFLLSQACLSFRAVSAQKKETPWSPVQGLMPKKNKRKKGEFSNFTYKQ